MEEALVPRHVSNRPDASGEINNLENKVVSFPRKKEYDYNLVIYFQLTVMEKSLFELKRNNELKLLQVLMILAGLLIFTISFEYLQEEDAIKTFSQSNIFLAKEIDALSKRLLQTMENITEAESDLKEVSKVLHFKLSAITDLFPILQMRRETEDLKSKDTPDVCGPHAP